MNKQTYSKNNKPFALSRIKEILIIGGIALALAFAVWKVFYTDDNVETIRVSATPTEEKVCRLIQAIDGVGKAEVIVYETEDGVQSVVVVCEGANDLQVVLNVREAVSSALGTAQKNVKIYQKKGD